MCDCDMEGGRSKKREKEREREREIYSIYNASLMDGWSKTF